MVTEMPFGLRGKILRTDMPYHATYDPHGRVLEEQRAAGVTMVVLLASDEECQHKAGRSLRDVYRAEGWSVIYLPTGDFQPLARLDDADSVAALIDALQRVLAEATDGHNVAVHCSAGIGRTGTFLALLRRAQTGCAGEEAIAWVRHRIRSAVETAEQRDLVLDLRLPDVPLALD